jgi:hypothetical protein
MLHATAVLANLTFITLVVVKATTVVSHVATALLITGQPFGTIGILTAV